MSRHTVDRVNEKSFVEGLGGRAAPWREVKSFADLEAAIAEGATLVRVGSALFGARAAAG